MQSEMETEKIGEWKILTHLKYVPVQKYHDDARYIKTTQWWIHDEITVVEHA